MKKPDAIEQTLDRLSRLRSGSNPETVEELRQALRHRSNLVAAKAATIVRELRLQELMPDLASCFHRFMADPARLDKRCAAVTEVVSALYEMDSLDSDIYLRGIRHVQKEGSFGPPVDTAAKLRAQCALGLVRTSHPEAMPRIVDLLTDPEPQARIGAIRALGACGGNQGALLLRLKARTGDPEPEVLGECFTALLAADFQSSLELLIDFMNCDDDSVVEQAIMALASQRNPQALAALEEKWQRTVNGPVRATLLAAIATMRLEEATQFLLGLLDQAAVPTAIEVLQALARYHNEERVRMAVQEAVTKRGNRQLTEAFRREF